MVNAQRVELAGAAEFKPNWKDVNANVGLNAMNYNLLQRESLIGAAGDKPPDQRHVSPPDSPGGERDTVRRGSLDSKEHETQAPPPGRSRIDEYVS